MLGRAAEDEAADDVRMLAGDELGDRAAHRVADDGRRRDSELPQDGGRVCRAITQAEPLDRSQAAAVTAMVDRQHAVAGPLQIAIGG